MVMDVYQDYLLVTYRPFDVHIYHVKLSGELTPSSSPDLQVKLPWSKCSIKLSQSFFCILQLKIYITISF